MRTESEVQAHAVRQVTELTHALRQLGWGFVAMSLWRQTRGLDAASHGSGASYFEVSAALMPFAPRLADNLEALAGQMRAGHLESGAPEAMEAYTHVIQPPTLYHGETRCEGRGCSLCAAGRVVQNAMAEVPHAVLDRVARLDPDLGPSLAFACQAEINRRKGAT